LKGRFPNLVLVPVGGRARIRAFSDLNTAVLEKTIWGVDFFMLCDRDAVPASTPPKSTTAGASDRLQLLPRYHLENYFLDEHIIAQIFSRMEPEGSWLRSPDQILHKLKSIAKGLLSYAAALIVSSTYRETIGNLDIMPKACNGKTATELVQLILSAKTAEVNRITSALDEVAIKTSIETTFEFLDQSLNKEHTWKYVIPGKPLLHSFAAQTSLPIGRFKLMYLKEAEQRDPNPFKDIIAIFEKFSLWSATSNNPPTT
jgi:hypothetical protein